MQIFSRRVVQNVSLIAQDRTCVMVNKFVKIGMVVILTLLWCKAASAQMVLYDDFHAGVIDPAKWAGVPDDQYTLEVLREITGVPGVPKAKQLHLYERSYSTITDNNGTSASGLGLSFTNPSAVKAVSFNLVINKLGVGACKTNPGTGDVIAQFIGSFCIDSPPTSINHDVVADIDVEENLCCGGPRVTARVAETNGTVLGWQVLGTPTLKSANTLFLQWDQPNHQFIFQLNNDPQVFESYSVSDTSPPFYASKQFNLLSLVPDCTSSPRPYGVMDADIRDVYVNQ